MGTSKLWPKRTGKLETKTPPERVRLGLTDFVSLPSQMTSLLPEAIKKVLTERAFRFLSQSCSTTIVECRSQLSGQSFGECLQKHQANQGNSQSYLSKMLADMAAKLYCETNMHMTFSNKKAITATRVTSKLEDPWPHCAEVIKTLKGIQTCSRIQHCSSRIQHCSDSMQGRMDGYGAQDTREILKQTMLKQEEIFRGQVRELHRLYRVQKMLMADLKDKSIGTSKLSSATSQKSPFIFQFGSDHVQLEGKRNFRDPLNGFVTDRNKNSYRLPICGKDRDQTLRSDFLGKSLQIGLSPKETKDGSQDFYRLQPSRATCRTFDLEQPAETYMNDKATSPNKDDRILRIAVKNTKKEDKSLNFSLFLEHDSDVELTLGTGYGKGKKVASNQKTPPSLGLAFPEFIREQPTECRSPIVSDELKLYSPASVGSEATIQENIRTLEGTQERSQEPKNNEEYRAGWQRFDIEDDKSSKERHFLDLQIGEKSKQENHKQPPWLLQALNLNRT